MPAIDAFEIPVKHRGVSYCMIIKLIQWRQHYLRSEGKIMND